MKKIIYNLLKPFALINGFIIKKMNFTIYFDDLKIKFPGFMNSVELGYSIFGTYEKSERILVKKYIKPEYTVLELGACIGVVSCTINRMLNDKSKQVSVEPNPNLQDVLLLNKKKNNADFHIESCIVSNDSIVKFYGGGKAFLSSNTLHENTNVSAVNGITLQDLISKYFDFDAIVMDIEGGELKFFQDFDLKKSNIKTIIFETHLGILTSDQFNECFSLLTSYGFNRMERINAVEVWGK
jgi:FkbM family methyltransferase